MLEYVHDKKLVGAKTLFATHYHELTALEDQLPGVKNFNIAVKKRGDDITFLRRIVRGGADDSLALRWQSCRRAGQGVSVPSRCWRSWSRPGESPAALPPPFH